jgi:hypothetical protein
MTSQGQHSERAQRCGPLPHSEGSAIGQPPMQAQELCLDLAEIEALLQDARQASLQIKAILRADELKSKKTS